MQQPSIAEIDQIRSKGFRPQIVGCFLNEKKILFLYKREYDLWQLPQGGIDNGEDLEVAYLREMTEEIGGGFINSCAKEILLFYADKIEFPSQTQDSRELKNDAGQAIFMKGKKYFFVRVDATKRDVDIANSEFDDFQWLSFEDGLILSDKIYQVGKKRITIGVLNKLRELGLL
jgi:putative (di)nucleoside polyphosphate hydrolase